jgi:hypothetical protein
MSKTPVYKVKRFGSQYWIEKDNDHYHGRVKALMDITVPKYFNSPNEAWKWVEYLEEGVVDVPKPARLSPTGMSLDQAFDEPRPVREPNTLAFVV